MRCLWEGGAAPATSPTLLAGQVWEQQRPSGMLGQAVGVGGGSRRTQQGLHMVDGFVFCHACQPCAQAHQVSVGGALCS